LRQRPGHPDVVEQAPFRTNGLEYEIEEAQRCKRTGRVKSPRMTHSDYLAALRTGAAFRLLRKLQKRSGIHRESLATDKLAST